MFAADVMVGDLAPELQGVAEIVRPAVAKLSVVVGGVFGLYLILIFVRVYYERKNYKILKDIRYDLDQLNMYHGLAWSQKKGSILRRVVSYVKDRKKTKKEKKRSKSKKSRSKVVSKSVTRKSRGKK